jgi:sulfate permease, SulP family
VPENPAYGLIAMAPLGAAFGPEAMALAILGAVVANAVASVSGAGRLAVGPRSSVALLTAGLVASLAQAHWHKVTSARGPSW